MLRHLTVFAAVATLSSLAAATQAASYHAIATGFYANGVTNSGIVAGYYNQGQYGIYTVASGLTLIGGVQDGGQAAISRDGTLVMGQSTNLTTGEDEASLYSTTTGTWTTLGNIGSSSGSSASNAWGMNGNGSIIVGLGWVNAGSAHATVFRPGQPAQDLGTTVVGSSTRANAVNADGSTIVGWQDAEDGFRQGAYWKNGVQTLLTTDDGQVSEAGAVTPDGRYIVGDGNFATQNSTWRYDTTTQTFEILGTLSPFNSFRGSTGISDDGSVVVGYDRGNGPATFGQGTYWSEATGLVNLTTFVTGLGVDLGGRRLALPLGISPDGTQIVGYDNTGNGFLVTVPEPTSLSILSVVSATMLRRSRR